MAECARLFIQLIDDKFVLLFALLDRYLEEGNTTRGGLHAPLTTSPMLLQVHQDVRGKVPFYARDRLFAPDIESATQMVSDGDVSGSCQALFAHLYAA